MSSSKLDLRLRLGITPRQKAIMWHPTKGPPCGLFFRNSLHIDGIALTDIYSLIPFLRVRNLGVAYWGDSGLGFLMRLPPSCRPGLQSSQGSMAAGESDSKLHCVVVGRKLQFLTGCWPEVSIPHHMDLSIGCFGVLRMWKLVPREGLIQRKRRERVCVIKIAPKTEATVNLISEWWTITSAVSYSSHKPPLVECGSGLHEDVNTGRWGSSRAIVESGCHSLKQRYQMTVQTAVSPQPWKQKLH